MPPWFRLYQRALTLSLTGQRERAHKELLLLRDDLLQSQGEYSLDYGLVSHALGAEYLGSGNWAEAELYLRQAWNIYQLHFGDTPELLIEKQAELSELLESAKSHCCYFNVQMNLSE